MITESPSIVGRYRHYRDPQKEYEVLGIARHSETLEELVVYKALYAGDFPKDQLWVRPKTMFFESLVHNGQTVPRFTKL